MEKAKRIVVEFDSRGGEFTKFCRKRSGLRAESSSGLCTGRHTNVFEHIVGEFAKIHSNSFLFQIINTQIYITTVSLDVKYILNVAPCMLPHLLYNPTHTLFTL
jgi:hypothetical protein